MVRHAYSTMVILAVVVHTMLATAQPIYTHVGPIALNANEDPTHPTVNVVDTTTLNNGNIVIVYQRSNASGHADSYYRGINPTDLSTLFVGKVYGGADFTTGGQNPNVRGVSAIDDGGFVVTGVPAPAWSTTWLERYDANGVVQGAPIDNMLPSSSAFYLEKLSNGNLLTISGCYASIFTSNGTVIVNALSLVPSCPHGTQSTYKPFAGGFVFNRGSQISTWSNTAQLLVGPIGFPGGAYPEFTPVILDNNQRVVVSSHGFTGAGFFRVYNLTDLQPISPTITYPQGYTRFMAGFGDGTQFVTSYIDRMEVFDMDGNSVSQLLIGNEPKRLFIGISTAEDWIGLEEQGGPPSINAARYSLNPPPPECDCTASALTTDYTQDRVPDAAQDAFATIALNESTWEVEFTVHNVRKITNGHVLAASVNPRATAASAFTGVVSSFSAGALWNPANCTLNGIDTPASNLGITVTAAYNCTRSYRIVYSLVNTANQNAHCQLVADADDLRVGCHLILSSVRAYDLTEPTAFLTSETSFTANITLPRNLNNNVSDLLYATLAKCNVLNFPEFAIDCRVPGLWNFETTFSVAQNIDNWIDASSCVQSQTAVATFVRCGLNSVPVAGYTEASANVTATVAGTSETLTFSLEYTLPRAASATASASLQNFIISIGMLNEKYYYAGADRATLYIHVFDTSRLQITQLDMFNANGQTYALADYPQFQLSQTNNATHFIIEFRPSAIRQDSAFYRNGPHGVNVSFLFTAASTSRRQMVSASTKSDGFVVFDNLRVQGDAAAAASNSDAASSSTAGAASASTAIIAAVAGVAVLAVGSIAAAVVINRRRRAGKTSEPAAEEQRTTPGDADCEVAVPEDQV